MKKKVFATALAGALMFSAVIGTSAMAGPPADQEEEVLAYEVGEMEVEPEFLRKALRDVRRAAKRVGRAAGNAAGALLGKKAVDYIIGGQQPQLHEAPSYEQVKTVFDQ